MYNFNKDRSAGGLKISFDLDADSHNSGDLNNWGAVTFGASYANRHPGVNGQRSRRSRPRGGVVCRAPWW